MFKTDFYVKSFVGQETSIQINKYGFELTELFRYRWRLTAGLLNVLQKTGKSNWCIFTYDAKHHIVDTSKAVNPISATRT